jgi:hypothetical protein
MVDATNAASITCSSLISNLEGGRELDCLLDSACRAGLALALFFGLILAQFGVIVIRVDKASHPRFRESAPFRTGRDETVMERLGKSAKVSKIQ